MTAERRALLRDRALGALFGGAIGDALGMPTQGLSPAAIAAAHGHVDRYLEPAADHPVSRGLPAGSITDDTEQTLLLGRALLRPGDRFDHAAWARDLLDWETETVAAGRYDLLGPSTKRAIDALKAGAAVEDVGRAGATNGAAMRAGPLGILLPSDPLDALVEKVAEVCLVTHNTSLAIAAASAVAAAVSTGIDGGDWRRAADRAVEAARIGSRFGHWVAGADSAARIGWARDLVRGRAEADARRLVIDLVGTSVAAQESVPAAFAVLEIADGDPWRAAIIAANLGGDTDTIGAIAAGIAGASAGYSNLPDEAIAGLTFIDPDAFKTLADDLLAARLAAVGNGGR